MSRASRVQARDARPEPFAPQRSVARLRRRGDTDPLPSTWHAHRFDCARLHATIAAGVCVARQTEARNGHSDRVTCVACPQGRDVASLVSIRRKAKVQP